MTDFGFYWGSIDGYNYLDLLGLGETISESQVAAGPLGVNGDQSSPNTNRWFEVHLTPAQSALFTGLQFRSASEAFEFDNVAFRVAAVPEPATWGMLIVGLGFVGASMRRRDQAPLAHA